MEVCQRTRPAGACDESSTSAAAASTSGSTAAGRKRSLSCGKALTPSLKKMARAEKPPSIAKGGLSTVKTPWGPQHCARIMIGGIAIATRYCRGRQEATENLKCLVTLVGASRGCPVNLESQLLTALPGDCVDRLALRFRATVDARRHVGRTLSSHAVRSLTEALELQAQMRQANLEGWPALRRLWKHLLQESCCMRSGAFGKRALTAAEAEAKVAKLDGLPPTRRCRDRESEADSRAAANQKRLAARRQELAARREARSQQHLQRLVEKLTGAVRVSGQTKGELRSSLLTVSASSRA
eukprot:TRINITY_DN22647_c0_g1_i2.p1 TRINITY_DN22647_c0_g1~~TRINITY_DN22647_c0_g1_i2.p1  ORF type:complete len:298 (+),score=60.77 TRINITY_DN22647_c0_g1_i2:303-1196(+)